MTETEFTKKIEQLVLDKSGIHDYWHKRLVRSGPNTLLPYRDRGLPDRIIQNDDILFVDLGPVFEKWEADFGRTFVLGNDPLKKQLRDALLPVWTKARDAFWSKPHMSGSELYAEVRAAAREAGYEHLNPHAGHLVGDYPHEKIPKDKVALYIHPENGKMMKSRGRGGGLRHWILEVHLVDSERGYGGFFEQLLSVDGEGRTPWKEEEE
jgi:Xaa-Pro aminopeptidase